MNAFDDARTIEARSLMLLRPFLEETQGRFVMTGKGRLAKYLQETVGDLLLNSRDGRIWGVELKAEQRWTGNLFLETWSNRNLDDADRHAMVGSKVGWLYGLKADLLFYHFLDADRLVILNMFSLKQWAFRTPSRNMSEPNNKNERSRLPGRLYDFRETEQKSREQLNDTRGRLVPVKVLEREMSVLPRIFSVRQLGLDLFESEAA